jgi:hypothetical protein
MHFPVQITAMLSVNEDENVLRGRSRALRSRHEDFPVSRTNLRSRYRDLRSTTHDEAMPPCVSQKCECLPLVHRATCTQRRRRNRANEGRAGAATRGERGGVRHSELDRCTPPLQPPLLHTPGGGCVCKDVGSTGDSAECMSLDSHTWVDVYERACFKHL